MDAKISNAIENVERLRTMFDALFVVSSAIKSGVLDEQTLAERHAQLKRLQQELDDAKAEKAKVVADLAQQKTAADALLTDAKVTAHRLVSEAQTKAASLLEAAEAGADDLTRSANAQRQADLEQHAALMAGKQATLADLDRQVAVATQQLSALAQQHDAIEQKVNALKAAAAKVLG